MKAIHLGTLVRVFFGQDYDLFGEGIDEILASYRNTENQQTIQKTIDEANMLLTAYPEEKELELEFADLAEGEFSPASWGYNVQSFLEKVVVTLSK
ncbi:contact-dependent growth inhibition system immunity protein [Yersinia wautersii]|uniref:contact-dependent growth inhibition system immunity protein n=1 Tax=Yersinia wautersii TaxID=1341643 RepID=UPI0004162E05|nr:contact-dependent growth inhibition system immunity protein [Yersinia wautersii]